MSVFTLSIVTERASPSPPVHCTCTMIVKTPTSGVSWVIEGKAAVLPDGDYTVAIRPHHVTPHPATSNDVTLSGTVLVTELSGSESSAHFQMGEDGWVSLAHGVHLYQVGEDHQFFMDPSKAFYFASDGRRAA